MKKKVSKGVARGGALFEARDLEAARIKLQSGRKRSTAESSKSRSTSVDSLISRAKVPMREGMLFEESQSNGPGKAEYRFNFYGGTVR